MKGPSPNCFRGVYVMCLFMCPGSVLRPNRQGVRQREKEEEMIWSLLLGKTMHVVGDGGSKRTRERGRAIAIVRSVARKQQ